MNLAEKAYKSLFPEGRKRVVLRYSNAFKPFNANAKMKGDLIILSFSHHWQDVSEEIQLGLAQHLLLKLFKKKVKTLNTELYEKFVEKLPSYVRREEKEEDPELAASFNRVNEKYFNGFLEKPALEWGSYSKTLLGSYSYHTDTVRISALFKGLREEWLLDYVMYHELLHKKLGLKHEQGSCKHHPKAFKELEARFEVKDAEELLKRFVERRRSKTKAKKNSSMRKYLNRILSRKR